MSACTSSPPSAAGSLRYLALGDSYTIGEGVIESQQWPIQLATALRAEGIGVSNPEIVARTGWTTDELSSALDVDEPQGPFDLVTLLIGVNNQYRGGSLGAYRAQFRALLQRATGYAGGNTSCVIAVSIPDWSVTLFAEERNPTVIAAQIDVFNAAAQQEATQAGIEFVEVTALSRSMPEAVVADGLHPSGDQYAAWVELLLPAARRVLGGR